MPQYDILKYNSYGGSIADLRYDLTELCRIASLQQSPFDFTHNHPEVFRRLTEGFKEDLDKGLAIPPSHENGVAAIVCMPNDPWTRRINGVLGNELANRYPDRAHVVVTHTLNSNMLQVSIRAPRATLEGLMPLLAAVAGGGGRKIEAGIKAIEARPVEELWRVPLEAYC